jgi:hypothetical protein
MKRRFKRFGATQIDTERFSAFCGEKQPVG